MLTDILFILMGLAGLWIGANTLVYGIKNFARAAGMSELFIGLAFLSIGTTVPEISVSITGALHGLFGVDASGIVVGNAIGSAIANIALFIGILAVLTPFALARNGIRQHAILLLASIILVFTLGIDGSLSRTDGILLLGAYAVYYFTIIIGERATHDGTKPSHRKTFVDIAYAILGLCVVLLSSNIVIDQAILLSAHLGIAQSLIGLLIVSIGTGLPELPVAIASVRQRAPAISIGDLIGSSISVLLLALGAGSVINDFAVDQKLMIFDLPALLALAGLFFAFWYARQRLTRLEGFILIALYLTYAFINVFVLRYI